MPKSVFSSPPSSDVAAQAGTPPPDEHTFAGRVKKNKLTVRTLCGTLHVAAESLRAAFDEPGRLTINAVMAFSEMVGEPLEKVAADLFVEVGELRKKGPAQAAPKRSRTFKAKVPEGD